MGKGITLWGVEGGKCAGSLVCVCGATEGELPEFELVLTRSRSLSGGGGVFVCVGLGTCNFSAAPIHTLTVTHINTHTLYSHTQRQRLDLVGNCIKSSSMFAQVTRCDSYEIYRNLIVCGIYCNRIVCDA